MKHLKLFEQNNNDYRNQAKIINSNNIIYIAAIVDDNGEASNYAFYNEESRENFLINLIYEDFDNANDSIKDIFDINDLITLFNEGDETIYLNEAEIFTDVKLSSNLQMRKDSKKYNL